MDAGPRIDAYDWSGGREAMLRFGPEHGPKVVVALPLFEEANRVRAFAASICRALAGLGIGSILPDLPGQGESLISTERARLADLRAAFAAVPGDGAVAIRSSALVVDEARPCWILSPQTGPDLLRELARVKGGALTGERVEVAGNPLSRALLDDLAADAHPGQDRGGADRIIRLATDPGTADRKVDGAALWRRAEPGNDPLLARILATDIAEWIAKCEG